VPEPSGCCLEKSIERAHLPLQMLATRGGKRVGLAPIVGSDRLNPAAFFETRDRAIQRPWSQVYAREALDIFHHGVTVLGAVGKAGQNQQSWVGHCYYGLRSIVARNTLPVN